MKSGIIAYSTNNTTDVMHAIQSENINSQMKYWAALKMSLICQVLLSMGYCFQTLARNFTSTF